MHGGAGPPPGLTVIPLLAIPTLPLSRHQRLECMAIAAVGCSPILLHLPLPLAAILALMAAALALYTVQYSPSRWARHSLNGALLFFAALASATDPHADLRLAVAFAALMVLASNTHHLRQGMTTLTLSLMGLFITFLNRPTFLDLGIAGLTLVLLVAQSQRLAAFSGGISVRWRQTAKDTLAIVGWGVPLALMALMVGPSLSASMRHRWYTSNLGWTGGGTGEQMTPGDLDRLLLDPATAFRVTFADAPPAPVDRYWRIGVLWNFDGMRWTRPDWANERSADGTAIRSVADSPTWRYRINPSKPTLHVTLDGTFTDPVPPGSHWTADRTLKGGVPDPKWNWTAQPIAVDATPLTEAERHASLQLPEGMNPRTHELVARWKERYADPRDLMAYALSMFRSTMRYSTDAPAFTGPNRIDELLFRRPVGYCQHFSSAFAVLMREAGIPSRIVTGYYGGKENTWGNYWRVQESDAHVWVEVWLEDTGWMRIDPTSAVNGWTDAPSFWRSWLSNDFFDWLAEQWDQTRGKLVQWGQSSFLGRLAWERWVVWAIPLLLVVTAALSWRLLRRRTRRRDEHTERRLLRMRNRLQRHLLRLHPALARFPFESMTAYADRAAPHLSPADAQQLRQFVQRWNGWRYGGTVDATWEDEVKRWRPERPSSRSART